MKTLTALKIFLIVLVILGLTGCFPSPFSMPTLQPTFSLADIITDTPLPMPVIPTATETPLPTATEIPSPTATKEIPTATPTPTLIPQFQKPTATLDLLSSVQSVEGAACLPKNTPEDLGIVLNVLSGDSFLAIINGKQVVVGYMGIQAPTLATKGKLGGFYAINALQRNNQLANGQIVTLIKDTTELDARGRVLRYVVADGVFINYELVRQGYAISLWPSSDSACRAEFDASQQTARTSLLGMWLVTATPVYVPSVH